MTRTPDRAKTAVETLGSGCSIWRRSSLMAMSMCAELCIVSSSDSSGHMPATKVLEISPNPQQDSTHLDGSQPQPESHEERTETESPPQPSWSAKCLHGQGPES